MSPRADGHCAVSSSSSTTELNRWHFVRQNSENSHCPEKVFLRALGDSFGLFSVFHHLADTFPKCAENSYTITLIARLGFHFGRTRRMTKNQKQKKKKTQFSFQRCRDSEANLFLDAAGWSAQGIWVTWLGSGNGYETIADN